MALQIDSPDYPIHSVTVYSSSKAEIVRLFPIQLKAGQNKIEIKSLPGTLDTQSIRISGLGTARLHDVVCLLNARKRPGPTDSSEIIDAMRTKRDRLVKEREHLTNESKVLLDYSRTLTGEHISPNDIEGFLKTFGSHGKKNLDAIAKLDDDLKKLDAEVRAEQDRASLKKGPRPNGEVTIVIASEEESNIDLKLTYIVTNASWQPTYELHATTSNGKPSPTVTLSYRALIQQSTGEDWNDAHLTLSTSNTSMNTTIPELPSIKIRPRPHITTMSRSIPPPPPAPMAAPPPPPGRAVPKMMATMMRKSKRSSSASVDAYAPEVATASYSLGGGGGDAASEEDEDMGFALMDEEVTGFPGGPSVKDSALSVSYNVQGESTIPSDGIAHMVSISELEFTSDIKYIAVPRVEAVVYLQCEVKNTSEYRLLPGSVGVILDDSFVSQTSILDVPAGDTFTCTLGVDPATKITYSRKATHSDVKAGAFSEAKRTTSYTVKVTVTNKHTFALEDLLVREVLPMVDVADPFGDGADVSSSGGNSSSKARVLLRKPLGLAEAKDGDVFTLDGKKVDSAADGSSTSGAESMKVRWAKAEAGSGGDKEGKFEWFGGLGQGEKVELEAGWDIKAPEDVKWMEVTV